MSETKRILFMCVENAGRSQMAEGFFRKYCHSYEPQSAGTEPTKGLNPLVVEAMKEIGIDISTQKPKIISDSLLNQVHKVINMGCMDKEACPALFVSSIDWNIPDPKGKPIDEVRKIRDLIEKKVQELCKTLQ